MSIGEDSTRGTCWCCSGAGFAPGRRDDDDDEEEEEEEEERRGARCGLTTRVPTRKESFGLETKDYLSSHSRGPLCFAGRYLNAFGKKVFGKS